MFSIPFGLRARRRYLPEVEIWARATDDENWTRSDRRMTEERYIIYDAPCVRLIITRERREKQRVVNVTQDNATQVNVTQDDVTQDNVT